MSTPPETGDDADPSGTESDAGEEGERIDSEPSSKRGSETTEGARQSSIPDESDTFEGEFEQPATEKAAEDRDTEYEQERPSGSESASGESFTGSDAEWGVNDQKAHEDKLDFETYVSVLSRFLTNERTKPPLTVSIEGQWGTGKSSFMALLERSLEAENQQATEDGENATSGASGEHTDREGHDGEHPREGRGDEGGHDESRRPAFDNEDADHERENDESPERGDDEDAQSRTVERTARRYFTVEFNPWRHEQEDALWAAFVLEFFHQITADIRFRDRWRGHLRMARYRLHWRNGWRDLLRIGLVVPLIALALLFPRIATGLGVPLNEFGLAVGQGVSVVALGLWTWQNVANPIETELRAYIDDPDYENRVSFIEQFHDDFAEILDSYVGDTAQVCVFIDDLDRCPPPKAAELIQSINLMISAGDPRVFFIIGMDREKVAAGIAAKHRDLLPYLRASEERYSTGTFRRQAAEAIGEGQERAGTTHTTEPIEVFGLDFADNYLEKFVQIPFLIPKPGENEISNLIREMTTADEADEATAPSQHVTPAGTEDGSERKPRKPPAEVDVLPSDQIVRIGTMVAPALNYNPRMIKTFVNLFRLRTMLATELGLFEAGKLTPEQLGKFVAISLQWPTLVPQLRDSTVAVELYEFAMDDTSTPPPAIQNWSAREQTRLLNLLTAGVVEDPQPDQLARLPGELFWISPRVDTPSRSTDESAVDA